MVNTQTGLARGAALVPASALLDSSFDTLFDELLSHEEATHTNKTALAIVRRQAARHGLFCDLPHPMLGSALVAYAILCPHPQLRYDSDTDSGTLAQFLQFSPPKLPQVYSCSYLHELCQGALLPLLQASKFAKFEGLNLLVCMSKLVRTMQKGLSANNADICNLPGYIFVPCMALEAPRLPLPPGQCTSKLGAAAATSGLAAFIAVQAKYNYECIKLRLEKGHPAALEAQNSSNKSSDKQPGTDPHMLSSRVENVAHLASMSARSCDALMLVQTCVTAIQQCQSEQLAREALDALKMQLLLFEPRSLLLLLRKMVRECPYPGMTAMLIDVGRDATQLFARGGELLPTLSTTNASTVVLVSDEDSEETHILQEIRDEARLEQEREDAMLVEGEEEGERERRQEQARMRQELAAEDSILVHKFPWRSSLVLEAFAPPLIQIGKFASAFDILRSLLEHSQCASLEASISLYSFFAIKLNAATERGDLQLVDCFWGRGSAASGPDGMLQKHCGYLLFARKAIAAALTATDTEDPAGDIAAVDATSPQDCLRLRVLYMNVNRVINLL